MNIVILLCAGRGNRLSLDIDKCFIKVDKLYLYEYSLNTFFSLKEIDKIILVSSLESLHLINLKPYKDKVEVIIGGNTRQESIFNALNYLYENKLVKDNDNILIHDGARPLISKDIIINNIKALNNHDFNITYIRNIDTSFFIKDDKLDNLINRDEVVFEQTPTSSKFKLLYDLHKKALKDNLYDIHDDATLALLYKKDVYLVEGSKLNFKITYLKDIDLLKYYLTLLDK